MEYKVIFDTNAVLNEKSAEHFLGVRLDFKKFQGVTGVEIILPDMVIEEIKKKKEEKFKEQQSTLLLNPFPESMGYDKKKIKEFKAETHVSKLKNKETIQYNEITLSEKEDALDKMKELCLGNRPPFEEKTDKGFKDAYIYFTVLEYLETYKDKVFFVSKDERLKEAFKEKSQVILIKNFEEFEECLAKYFKEEYFIDKLKGEFQRDIKAENIEETWLNAEKNWIVKILIDKEKYFLEVDFLSKEIVSHTDVDFAKGIDALISSDSFARTHECIDAVKDYVRYFSGEEIKKLIEAAIDNRQICLIKTDEDVREFFGRVAREADAHGLSKDNRDKFMKLYDLNTHAPSH